MPSADRVVLRVITDGRCDRLLLQLCQLGRRAVYCGLLDYAIRRGSPEAPGYAAHLFQEIFGDWPRSCDRGPAAALPNNSLINEWVANRKKRRKPQRVRIDKPAPLLDRVSERPPLELDADGFVPGTLMRPTADDYYFEWK